MKKTLLLCNAALYAIMYNIGLFFVGFVFGNTYEFSQIMYDGDWIALPLLWQYFFFPAVFLVCFFIGSHFVKCRENLSVKSFVILGAVTWIPLFAYWILLHRQESLEKLFRKKNHLSTYRKYRKKQMLILSFRL